MKFVLFFSILLIVGISMQDTECRVDSDCSKAKLCVNGECLNSNHDSGKVVVTDKNIDEACQPECSTGQKCAAGVCVTGS